MAIARLGAYLLGAAFPGLPGQAAGVRYFFYRLRPVGVVGASGRPSGRRRRPPTGGRSLKFPPRAGVPHPAAVVGGYYEFEGGVIFFFASLSFDLFFPHGRTFWRRISLSSISEFRRLEFLLVRNIKGSGSSGAGGAPCSEKMADIDVDAFILLFHAGEESADYLTNE